MEKSNHLRHFFLSTLVVLSIISQSLAALSTRTRYIVDPSDNRIKLHCVNWPGHLNAMIPEGLNKQPIKNIVLKVKEMGFNCVRLTWAVEMFTTSRNLTVEQSLNAWQLDDAKAGIQTNNPSILNMNLMDAQKAVIDELGANEIMVVLDNHVSQPMWCCGYDDGNGFFGDKYFNVDVWLFALGVAADRYKGNPTVVGLSLRNELRGPRENVHDWYNYMEQAAESIHRLNPDLLVIISGLTFDTRLGFLRDRPLKVSFQNKLVFEAHLYFYGDPDEKWNNQTNSFCGARKQEFLVQAGFLINDGLLSFPLFISEFGRDQDTNKEHEDNYLSCILSIIAKYDLEWSLWALQGSYMFREGTHDANEAYGMLNHDWTLPRNPNMRNRLQLIHQTQLSSRFPPPTNSKMFLPQTGLCVQANKDTVNAAECQTWASWNQTEPGSPIKLSDDGRCLVALRDGSPVSLSTNCSSKGALWSSISGSMLHIATKDNQGNSLCLELDSNKNIVTRKCLCLDANNQDLPHCNDNPTRQWFQLVPFSTN